MAKDKNLIPREILHRYEVFGEVVRQGQAHTNKQALIEAARLCQTSSSRLHNQFKRCGLPFPFKTASSSGKAAEPNPEFGSPVKQAIEPTRTEALAAAVSQINEEMATAKREADAKLRASEAENQKLRAEIRRRDDEEHEYTLASSLRFKPREIPITTHAAGSPGFPMTIWSDWHWGEEVDYREMGGLNVFNREIAQQRVDRLVDGTIHLLRNYGGLSPTYPGIWVNLGGDFISGKLHEELRETNWGTVEEQAYEVGCALAGALLAMANEFGHVYVPCVVGNHGRNALKPVAKRHVRENREWGIYKSLQKQFENDDRFEFFVPDEPDYAYEVYGHRFLLTHGNNLGVKGGDGIIGMIGPVTRGAFKLHRAESAIDREFDTLIMGHWHIYRPRGDDNGVIINGALKGFDEFARLILRVPYSDPKQALWLVSPKHGIIHQEAVSLL